MKISELVKLLNKFKKENGDTEIKMIALNNLPEEIKPDILTQAEIEGSVNSETENDTVAVICPWYF